VPATFEWGNLNLTVEQPEKWDSIPQQFGPPLIPGGVFLVIPLTLENMAREAQGFSASILAFDATHTLFPPSDLGILGVGGFLSSLIGGLEVRLSFLDGRIPPGEVWTSRVVFDVPRDALDFTLILWGDPGYFMLRLGI
jgi:hypothetical protein